MPRRGSGRCSLTVTLDTDHSEAQLWPTNTPDERPRRVGTAEKGTRRVGVSELAQSDREVRAGGAAHAAERTVKPRTTKRTVLWTCVPPT